MFNILSTWQGPFELNGVKYDSFSQFTTRYNGDFTAFNKQYINIKLLHTKQPEPKQKVGQINENQEYLITVKQYMTQKSNSTFDFMLKYNMDNPMPLRTMIGTKEKETRGMVYMKLRADIYAEQIQKCMKCGRTITNKISRYFGMGPECGGHRYTNPFSSTEELEKSISNYRKELQKITWEGWIIKSSLLQFEEITL